MTLEKCEAAARLFDRSRKTRDNIFDMDKRIIVAGWAIACILFGCSEPTPAQPAEDKGVADLIPRLDSHGGGSFFHPPGQWLKTAGGKDFDIGNAVVTDAKGNVYIAGLFGGIVSSGHSSATFGSITLTAQGKGDVFVAKMDSTGRFLWATSAGGPEWDEARSIAVDQEGNVYTSGTININSKSNSPVWFGSTKLIPKGDYDGFVARLSKSGAWTWVVQIGGSQADNVWDMALGSDGDLRVCGSFGSTVDLDGHTLKSFGKSDLYVARLTTAGNTVWATSAGGVGEDDGWALGLDGSGNTYATGRKSGSAFFGSLVVYGEGLYVAKLDPKGSIAYVAAAGAKPAALAANAAGEVFIAGNFKKTVSFGRTRLFSRGKWDVFVAKLNKKGQWAWAASAGGVGEESSYGVAVDSAGVYLTGEFNLPIKFGSVSLKADGFSDAYVARLDLSGTFTGAISAGSKGTDWPTSICVAEKGFLLVTGNCGDGFTYGGSPGTKTAGKQDVLIWKLAVP